MQTDTKFFTNSSNDALRDRLQSSLAYAQYFDVLVGYFRASGFAALAQNLHETEKIRILVGLNADSQIIQAVQDAENSLINLVRSHDTVHQTYAQAVQAEMGHAPERQHVEDSIVLFIKYINEGRVEIRGHPSQDIHAKVYIIRYKCGPSYGSIITGSSNFSASGFVSQKEFNVELKDKSDVAFALDWFEKLWIEGVELTNEFVATTTQRTWLNDSITPYELYLKFLYEYFKEDINIDGSLPSILPDGFIDLEYPTASCNRCRENS